MSENRKFVLSGNTYPFRKEISDAGGYWDKNRKVWLLPCTYGPHGQTINALVNRLRANSVVVHEEGR